jgi:hypothetical protein
MSFYSIGSSCLPKFGIDQYIGKTQTYFYDWLITDSSALEASLLAFNRERFFREGYEVCDNNMRVKDLHTGLRFQHDFPADAEGTVDLSKIEATINIVRERYIRRWDRLFACVMADPNPCFIRHDNWELGEDKQSQDDHALKLTMILDAAFQKPYRLIVASTYIQATRLTDTVLFHHLEPDSDIPWIGKKKDWELLLSTIG